MQAELWIDGVKVRFHAAHVRFVGDDGKCIQIGLQSWPVDSVRVAVVDSDGDIETDCPVTESRLRDIARNG